MNRPSSTYRPTASNATIAGTVLRFTSSETDPRKGWRTPLNKNRCSEQRDEETGYGYFGARYMDHELMTMWLSVDPMADKYPSVSPYAYCAWNPVRLVDPNGEEINPIYDENGNWICNTKEGFTGNILIYKGDVVLSSLDIESLSKMSSADAYKIEGIAMLDFWWDEMTSDALSKICTDVIVQSLQEHNSSIDFMDDTPPFTLNQLYGKQIYNEKEGRESDWTTNLATGKITGYGFLDYEYNVENILSAVIVHEWYGHAQQKWGKDTKDHHKCYEAVIRSKLWEATTYKFKNRQLDKFESLLDKECPL